MIYDKYTFTNNRSCRRCHVPPLRKNGSLSLSPELRETKWIRALWLPYIIEMTSCIAGTCTPLAIGPRDLPEITANLSLKIHLVDPIFKQLIKLRHSRSLKIIIVSRVNDNIKTDKQASSVCSWKDPKVRIRV